MKEENNMVVKIAIVVLAITMIALILLSGTFAKYISSNTAEDTARVAKWQIELNGESLKTSEIDLFSTILDSNYTDTETDVINTEKLIAPGTSGRFNLQIANKSEVAAQYEIDFTITNTANIPIEFSIDGGTTWTKDLTDIAMSNNTILAAKTGISTNLNVQWRWLFDGVSNSNYTQTDTTDTTLGEIGTGTVKVKAVVTVNQVD